MVLLVAWMASIAVSWLAAVPELESMSMVLALLPVGIAVCAALLAIAGLKDYSRSKGYYTQGQGQAISALVVSVLLLALIAVATFGGMLSAFQGRGHTPGGRPLVFEELNFKFLAPGGVWSQVDTNPLNLKATLHFRCARPEIYFLIVAQKTPSKPYSLDELCDLAIRNLSNAVDTMRVTYRAATYVAGQEGMRVHIEAARSGQKSYFQAKLLIARDCTYQLITWGADRKRIAISEEADYMLGRFTLLEASRASRKTEDSPVDSCIDGGLAGRAPPIPSCDCTRLSQWACPMSLPLRTPQIITDQPRL